MAGVNRQIGITIIIGFYSAFWIPQVFGHQHVSVLDGGLKQWMDNGGQIEEGENTADKVSQVTDYNIYMYIEQRYRNIDIVEVIWNCILRLCSKIILMELL